MHYSIVVVNFAITRSGICESTSRCPSSSRIDLSAVAAFIRQAANPNQQSMTAYSNLALAIAFCLGGAMPKYVHSAPAGEQVEAASGYLTSAEFEIEGLPQQQYKLEADYKNGRLKRVNLAGSVGYIIEPTGSVDAKRRWVWVVPLWLALPSQHGDYLARYYVQALLDAGFHVAGFDVGASLGSPKGAEQFAKFHDHIVREYDLAPKARMIAVSNGGLITYGYAFRNPHHVDRIFAIYPALDFRSWPKFELVVGDGAIAPKGLAYGLSADEMTGRIKEFNPIDNLKPLAGAGIPIFHIHGDADEIVPHDPNSTVTESRYREMGGEFRLKILKGGGHGGTPAFTDKEAVDFLTAPTPTTSNQ
jgi:hypothetical protein